MKVTIRPEIDLTVQNYGQNYRQNYRGRPQDSYKNDFRRRNYRETQNYIGKNYISGCRYNHRDNYRKDYRDNYRDDNFGRCRRGLEKDIT